MKIYKNKFKVLNEQIMDLNKKQLDARNKLNKKIRNNNISFEKIPCLCGWCDSFDLIASVDRYGLTQETVVCRNCGLIQSNPRMTEKEYKEFYESDVYRLICSPSDIEEYIKNKYNDPDSYSNDSKNIFERIGKFKPVDSSSNILEFGACGGYNLKSFNESGARVTGIDYSKKSVEAGKKYSVNMIQGGLEKIEGQYDVILLCHVLEHLLNPIAALKTIKEHLSKDGLLYISVPNMMNFGMGQIVNAHTYYFIPDNFEYYVECAGLKIIDFDVSQNIHMYGIFKVENIVPNPQKLLFSKKKMYKALSNANRLHYIKLGN